MKKEINFLESYFLQLASITEKSAFSCFPFIGKGDSYGADEQAVKAMREAFQSLPIDFRIVIGEGERDKAPRLYTGEKLGDDKSSLKIDVAVDPLEGTSICANGGEGALSVMAIAKRDHLFMAPDIYMKKIACGSQAKNVIDLELSATENIQKVAQALGKSPENIKVGVLNRSRHQELISEIRKTGSSVYLVEDGDVALALNTVLNQASLDLLMGVGGAPEGVLAAVGLKCLGGGFQGQLVFQTKEEEERALKAGVKDLHKVLNQDEVVQGECAFFATGVTSGSLLKGFEKTSTGFITHSLILAKNSQIELKNQHFFEKK